MIAASLRVLLSELVDYAGLFPPANLNMRQAARNFAEYKASEFSWMLGRFVVPVARLEELEAAARLIPASPDGDVWRLSVLSSPDATDDERFRSQLARDLDRVAEINGRDASTGAHPFQVEALEIKTTRPEHARIGADVLCESSEHDIELYYELPSFEMTNEFVRALAESQGAAKVRTGGLTGEMFPSPDDLLDFINACNLDEVAFKATAGLHHPLRGTHNFTYEPDSAAGTMHGFLNVFAAAAFIHNGALEDEEASEILRETSAAPFSFEEQLMTWRGVELTDDEIYAARRNFARSFGSCSFTEPIDDLRALNLL